MPLEVQRRMRSHVTVSQCGMLLLPPTVLCHLCAIIYTVVMVMLLYIIMTSNILLHTYIRTIVMCVCLHVHVL